MGHVERASQRAAIAGDRETLGKGGRLRQAGDVKYKISILDRAPICCRRPLSVVSQAPPSPTPPPPTRTSLRPRPRPYRTSHFTLASTAHLAVLTPKYGALTRCRAVIVRGKSFHFPSVMFASSRRHHSEFRIVASRAHSISISVSFAPKRTSTSLACSGGAAVAQNFHFYS